MLPQGSMGPARPGWSEKSGQDQQGKPGEPGLMGEPPVTGGLCDWTGNSLLPPTQNGSGPQFPQLQTGGNNSKDLLEL